jgi:hypothetical protein
MRNVILSAFIMLGASSSVFVHSQKINLMNTLPQNYRSYHVSELLDYTGEDLYDYINGGAELYLSYGLSGMTGCKYNGEGLPQITIEVYEMTEPKNAFGVYTQSRDREELNYGQGSQTFDDFILFWKDKYFVVITSHKSTTESREAIKHLAALVEESIPEEGDLPGIIDYLPSEGMVEGGFIYFHHYIWLNAFIFIADYNIVNISDETDAVIAKYGDVDERCYLLMVDYPTNEDAQAAGDKLKEQFAPELTASDPIIQLEDNTWFSMQVEDNRLAAVFNGNSRLQVEDLFQHINK